MALVGYDLVPVSRTNVNESTHDLWRGISSLRKQKATCEGAVLNVGDTIRTSVGAFDYVINAIADDDGNYTWPSQPAIEYFNSPLSGCDVTNLTLSAWGMIFKSALTVRKHIIMAWVRWLTTYLGSSLLSTPICSQTNRCLYS